MSYMLNWEDLTSYLSSRLGLSHGTIVTRKSRINIFCKWIEGNNQSFSQKAVEQFFYFLKTKNHLSNTSLNTYYNALLSLQSYLVDRKISKKFMKGFKRKKEEDPDVIPLSVEEIKLLKKGFISMKNITLAKTYQETVILFCDTGMRWEDGQALQVKSVDTIGQQLSYVQLKNRLRRLVHIEDPLLSIFIDKIKYKNNDDLVFTNSHMGPIHYSDFHHYLKELAKSVGITKRVSPHILRHSYAQNLYDQTGDIYLLKDVLGHKNINSTLRYLKNSGKRVKAAQQMHPHISDTVDPRIQINILEKEIEHMNIEKDPRFDALKVRRLITTFILGLNEAINPSHLP